MSAGFKVTLADGATATAHYRAGHAHGDLFISLDKDPGFGPMSYSHSLSLVTVDMATVTPEVAAEIVAYHERVASWTYESLAARYREVADTFRPIAAVLA